ncbi:MAG TPA: hypothetical protein VG755_19090, partial [Nannocystaceae bacterium]|nr:hypothetical protein [Nannocystaceae bacterium]
MPYSWRVGLASLIVGCTVDGPDGATSLGDPTYGTTATTTVGTTATTTTPGSESDSGSSSGEEEDAEASSAGSTAPDSEESSGDAESAGSSGGGVDEQPANGVFAACESSIDCVGAQYCVAVMPNVGFCSKDCEDPAADCPASPGGTATTACVAAMPIGAPAMVCALDCSGGKTCPGGMECAMLDAAM